MVIEYSKRFLFDQILICGRGIIILLLIDFFTYIIIPEIKIMTTPTEMYRVLMSFPECWLCHGVSSWFSAIPFVRDSISCRIESSSPFRCGSFSHVLFDANSLCISITSSFSSLIESFFIMLRVGFSVNDNGPARLKFGQ